MKKFYDKIISCFTLNFDMHLSYIDNNKLLNITKLFVIVLVNVTKKKKLTTNCATNLKL